MFESSAISEPSTRHVSAADARSPRRSRARTLTSVSKATRLGKRIEELKVIYTAALGGEAGLSDIMRLRVAEAAETKGLAERARGEYLRNGNGDIDNIIRAERRAVAAERALGITERAPAKAAPSLSDILSRHASKREAAPT